MEVRDREVNDPRGRNKSRDDEYTPRYTDTEVHQNLTLIQPFTVPSIHRPAHKWLLYTQLYLVQLFLPL